MFDLNETWPVGTKACHRASRRLMTAKKLLQRLSDDIEKKDMNLTVGNGPPVLTDIKVPEIQSSAELLHLSSTIPISHWCKAATVKRASR